MMIGNLYQHNRSQIHNIQLVLLCKNKFVKYFGFEKIINKLVDDLCFLGKSGINIEIHGKQRNVKGSLVAVTGDNLGSH